MPFTPAHPALVWPLHIKWSEKFDFLALSVGAIIPDVEIPLMIPFVESFVRARLLMHSLFGAVTVDLLLAVLIVIYVLPRAMRYLSQRFEEERFHRFAGVDLLKSPSIRVTVYSALIGTVSHVLIDPFTHSYNPIFFPFQVGEEVSMGILYLEPLGSTVLTVSLLLAVLYMVYNYWMKSGSLPEALKN